MHDRSLPLSDRVEPLAPTQMQSPGHRQALVASLPDGTYFRAWRRRRGCVKVRSLSRALLFSREKPGTINRMIAKLRRTGIEARAVEVEIRIGVAESQRSPPASSTSAPRF
jgi:hypothetical protein